MRVRRRAVFVWAAIVLFVITLGFWIVNRQLKAIELEAMKRDVFTTARKGTPDELRRMLDAGVDPNTKESYEVPLEKPSNWWESLGFGRGRTLVTLPDALTPLAYAAQNNEYRYDMVKLLLERGAKIPSTRSSMPPLFVAVVHNDFETTKLLIEHGADVNVTDTWGYTNLAAATRAGNPKIVRLLLENDARVTGREEVSTAPGGSPANGYNDMREIKQMLVKAKKAQAKGSSTPPLGDIRK